jgi:hypothetical protein
VIEMAAQDNDQRFEDFLEGLKTREDSAIEQALSKPIANYNEWAWHFELAKRQFTGLWEVFRKIEEAVPSWKLEDIDWNDVFSRRVSSEPQMIVCNETSSGTSGYSFQDAIARHIPNYNGRKAALNFTLNGIGSESSFVDYNELTSELCGLDRVKTAQTFRDYSTGAMLKHLDESRLQIRVATESEAVSRSFGIGYLYDHDLAEVGKQLFMLMNKPDVSKSELEEALPDGYFPRRPMPADDNAIIHDADPKWRND